MKNIKKNSGFTLFEVLIAILIFSIGMLGLAGLQLRAQQATSFAQDKTLATLGASHLVERMRANIAGVNAGAYAFDSAAGLPAGDAQCNTATGCNANNLAGNDLREWILTLNQSIPLLNAALAFNANANVRVCIDSTPDSATPANPGAGINCDGLLGQWTIYIDWVEQREDRNNNLENYRQTFTFTP